MSKTDIAIEELQKWVREVDKKLDNHLVHTASDISKIKNDIDWIKRFFWLVAGISVTSIGAAVFGLLLLPK